jgi:thiol-disulfide isomerase/thioredoxin
VPQTKRESRERARQAVIAQRRAAARRSNMIKAGIAVAVVIVVAGILVGVKLTVGSKSAAPATTASQSLVQQVTGVPAATLDTVGKGKIATLPKATSGVPVLTANGKPVVFYMGGEFCPFCAAERWSMIVALSRFGTFSNLSAINSSEDNIPTFTFHGSSYTSKYLDFQPVEVEDGNGKPLETLTAAQQQIVNKYDPPAAGTSGNPFPFVTIGNQSIVSGASYDPTILQGMTQDQIAANLTNPKNPVTQAILGTANVLTADICKVTKNQPSNVCSSPAVTGINGTNGG